MPPLSIVDDSMNSLLQGKRLFKVYVQTISVATVTSVSNRDNGFERCSARRGGVFDRHCMTTGRRREAQVTFY